MAGAGGASLLAAQPAPRTHSVNFSLPAHCFVCPCTHGERNQRNQALSRTGLFQTPRAPNKPTAGLPPELLLEETGTTKSVKKKKKNIY